MLMSPQSFCLSEAHLPVYFSGKPHGNNIFWVHRCWVHKYPVILLEFVILCLWYILSVYHFKFFFPERFSKYSFSISSVPLLLFSSLGTYVICILDRSTLTLPCLIRLSEATKIITTGWQTKGKSVCPIALILADFWNSLFLSTLE